MRKLLQDVGNENIEGGGKAQLNAADIAKTAKQQPEQAFDDDQGTRDTDQKEKFAVANVVPTLYNTLIVNDLTSTAAPSEKYWEVLSERRRKALEHVIEENQHLHTMVARLEEENSACKRLIESTTDIVNTLKEIIREGQYYFEDELSTETEEDTGMDMPASLFSDQQDQHIHKRIKLSHSDESSDSN